MKPARTNAPLSAYEAAKPSGQGRVTVRDMRNDREGG